MDFLRLLHRRHANLLLHVGAVSLLEGLEPDGPAFCGGSIDRLDDPHVSQALPSGGLDRAAVDRVVAAAKVILEQSTVFQELLRDLGALDSTE